MMTRLNWPAARMWISQADHPLARTARRLVRGSRRFALPVIPGLHSFLYGLHRFVSFSVAELARVAWVTPLFQSRLAAVAPRLYVYGGLPLILGPVRIEMGADCRVCGQSTISGRS